MEVQEPSENPDSEEVLSPQELIQNETPPSPEEDLVSKIADTVQLLNEHLRTAVSLGIFVNADFYSCHTMNGVVRCASVNCYKPL